MNVKNVVIGIVIAFVFLLFCVYGTNLLYKAPNYNTYCNVSVPPYTENITQQICESQNGTWIAQNIQCIKAPCPQGYCDYYSKCSPLFDAANKSYAQNLFIISIVISLIVIMIGAFLISVPSVSGGLMFGALMYLIYGTARYWGFMDNWLRFIILGVALVILIYIGYKIADRDKKKRRK